MFMNKYRLKTKGDEIDSLLFTKQPRSVFRWSQVIKKERGTQGCIEIKNKSPDSQEHAARWNGDSRPQVWDHTGFSRRDQTLLLPGISSAFKERLRTRIAFNNNASHVTITKSYSPEAGGWGFLWG